MWFWTSFLGKFCDNWNHAFLPWEGGDCTKVELIHLGNECMLGQQISTNMQGIHISIKFFVHSCQITKTMMWPCKMLDSIAQFKSTFGERNCVGWQMWPLAKGVCKWPFYEDPLLDFWLHTMQYVLCKLNTISFYHGCFFIHMIIYKLLHTHYNI